MAGAAAGARVVRGLLARGAEGCGRGARGGGRSLVAAMSRHVFRFNADTHTYYLNGEERPHITGMLLRTGWVNDEWFTEESCERGRMAHQLTADYDLGAVDVASCRSGYRGYLLTHVKAMTIARPEILAVEEACIHPELGYGGRPDRELVIYGAQAVLEGKSGGVDKSHQIQTALQAILIAAKYHLPAEQVGRYCLYWKLGERRNGSWAWRLEEHRDPRDFAEARRVIRVCT
jgi:hypothetical protein